MIPTETELRHFLEVYSTKHMTRSSIKLGIAQPSLTQSILKLEEKVKTKLFHRTKQGCIPTRAADLLYDKAIHLQETWKTLSEGMTETQDTLTGTFRVGCHQSVGTYTLPNFLKALSKKAPHLGILLHHDLSRKITEKIINYELDIGFVVNPTKHPDLVLVKLATDRVAFWRAKGVTPLPRIFADQSILQVQTILGKRSHARLPNYQVIETTSLELIRTLTLSGAGIGILPERVAKADHNHLEIVDSSLPTFHDEIFLAYRMDTLKSAAGKALIAAARSCI